MSLTKKEFDDCFQDRTISDATENKRRNEGQPKVENNDINDDKLQELLDDINKITRVNLIKKDIVNRFNTELPEYVILKGRYRGMIYTNENHIIKKIKVLIGVYGFNIDEFFFLEETDQGFTNLEFTIKRNF